MSAFRLVQITDLHVRPDDTPLSGRVLTRPYTAAAIDRILALHPPPDAVIVTGDLTDIGTPEEYALLRAEIDRLPMPVYAIPGNHDRREEMRAAFADHAYMPGEGALRWVIDDHPLRLIGLDSVVPGHGHGTLDAESLAWLDRQLDVDTRPTIVAIHHPPFPTGIPAMDAIGCLNGSEMAAVIAQHGHVERVIAGHHHRPVQVLWAGTMAMISPSVAHQVNLDMEPRDRPRMVMEPPAFLLHQWQDGRGLISHQVYVDTCGGPLPFRLDPDYPGQS
ncbi:MAG: phosphodiesterase [Pseudomonadota bacterium]